MDCGQEKAKKAHSLAKTLTPKPAEARCFNCLAKGHRRQQCKNRVTCLSCQTPGHLRRNCTQGIKHHLPTKPILTSTKTHDIPSTKSNPNNTLPPQKAQSMETLDDWEAIAMLAPDHIDAARPQQKQVFVPPRTELAPHCSQLNRSAIVLPGPNHDDQQFPHRLSTHLASYFGLRPTNFEVSPVHHSYGDYIVIFPTKPLRDRAVYAGVFNLGAGIDVQLAKWTTKMPMEPDPTSHLVRLRLHGVPMQNWNEDDLDILLAEVGHVAKAGFNVLSSRIPRKWPVRSCHNANSKDVKTTTADLRCFNNKTVELSQRDHTKATGGIAFRNRTRSGLAN